MIKASPLGLLLLMLALGSASAQTPTGTIAGFVTDRTGAALTGARVDIVNRHTGQARTLTTSVDGVYSAAALPSGIYQIFVEAVAFKRLEREASVEMGTTTTVDLTLELGEMIERLTVAGTQPLIRHDHHQVGGVVTRDQIENLPLNGRNFLELAKLEPGVTNPARLTDGRVFVSSLGGGLQTIPRIGSTRVTVDGASISTPGTVGVLLQVSQDVVEEFQISTVNFDLTSSLTSNGAINIVTWSGSNAYQGSGFYFYRDDHLAAYPGLRRDLGNPNPSFERHQFGSYSGGPLRKDRAFFFGSFERTDQVGVVSIQPIDEFAPLGGIFPSPYVGNQFNARVEVQLHPKHNALARYTYDRNSAFAILGPPSLPSGWSRLINQADQGIAGLTSVISPRIVNDLRFAYFSTPVDTTSTTSDDCGNCFGLGATRTTVQNGIAFGIAGGSSSAGRRYQVTESLVWQKGNHSLRAGFDWEHNKSRAFVVARSGEITVFPPSVVRQEAPEIPLPASFTTVEDILQLPLRSVSITVGAGAILWPGFREQRVTDLYRLYFGDTWRAVPRLTLNYGLGWSYEPNALSHDLKKPALLTSILGVDGLKPPTAKTRNSSPTLGLPVPLVEGVSLVGMMKGKRNADLDVYAESFYPQRLGWAPLRTVRNGRFKLIDAPRPELYDLARDPFEERNIHDDHPAAVAALTERLARLGGARTVTREASRVDAELRERVAALGYVGAGAIEARPDGQQLPDPKDCIESFNPRKEQPAAPATCDRIR